MQVRSRLTGRPVKVPLGQRSSFFAQAGSRSAKAAYSRILGYAEMRLWQNYFRLGTRGHDLFVDVGANAGLYTVLAGESALRVIAVEPAAAPFACLVENGRPNDIEIEAHRSIAGAERGSAALASSRDSRGYVLTGSYPVDADEHVDVVPVDELLGQRVAVGLKLDVEGYEEEVLLDATDALASHRIEMIQIEWNSLSERTLGRDRSNIVDLLQRYDYHRFGRPDCNGRLWRVTPDALADYGKDVFSWPTSLYATICDLLGPGT